MIDKLNQLEERFSELGTLIMDPNLPKDQNRYRQVMQEHSSLSEMMSTYAEFRETEAAIAETMSMTDGETDPGMKEMAQDELRSLEEKLARLEQSLRQHLVPKDPMDGKNAILEIRAGTGGDEAALFAADLFRMYQKLAEHHSWKIEVMSSNPTEIGGFKEIIFSVSGKGVYGDLRYESGGHRVQRVPETESGGRIHTSAVTVAVLPEAEETDIKINQEDLRIDVFRSSGPGGQSVNTTDSAVRITHVPSGLVVICQDEKSQLKNKTKALRVLKARLYEQEERKRLDARASIRRDQIGSGDRSERIRTYNFPQNRFTDHRINLTLYRLDAIMQGELDETIETLKVSDREAYLKEYGS